MLSLIQHEVVDRYHWLTLAEFTDVIAISQMTPGPIGINSATYIGYTVTGNIWGAILATVAVSLPSFVLVLLISVFFARFKQNRYVSAALVLMNGDNFIDYKSVLIFAAAFFLTWKYRWHPIGTICLAGFAGLILY